MTDATRSPEPWHQSALAPFRTRVFLAIWFASLSSNLGTLVQTVGASWLMVSLSHSPGMVALVQAATALPIMLLAVPAGAFADIWDRRTLMLVAQFLMAITAAVLTLLAFHGLIGPWALLGFTFLIGCGSALYGPAWQASVGEQVPLEQLPAAVSLNAISFNIARTVGPAIGGFIVAASGPPAAFLLNALSYVGLIVVLLRWRRPHTVAALPPESIALALGAGVRYARLSPAIRTVLLRSALFGFFACALWATMPLVARDLLHGGPLTYGFLLGAFGVGAVGSAFASTWLRRRHTGEAIATSCSVTYGIATVVIGHSPFAALTAVAFLCAGSAWVLSFSTFNITTQVSAPRWVVGRMLALYQATAFGGMAVGSWMWGQLTELSSLPAALTAAGALLAATVIVARRWPLHATEALNLDPAAQPDAPAGRSIDPEAGPVVTTVEYHIAPADGPEFLRLAHELGRIRRRNGARRWILLQDLTEPTHWLERYQTVTWLEHLRHASRATVADRELQERIIRLHQGPEPPRLRHLLARSPGDPHGEAPPPGPRGGLAPADPGL